MALKIDGKDFNNGEEVDYYLLFNMRYGPDRRFDVRVTPNSFYPKKEGILQYNQGGWMSKAGWILKDKTGKTQYDYNKINFLNNNPFDVSKYNVQLFKKGQGPVQAKVVAQPAPVKTVRTLSLGDDDYFNHQKVEYLIVTQPTLYPTLSGTRVDLTLTKDVFFTRNKGELMYNPISFAGTTWWWIVEGGKMTHDLSKFNILNNRPFTTNELNIQFLPSGNMTERMKKVKAEKERKAEEAAKEDQKAETTAEPIPCSQTAINLKDRVSYEGREGIVTGFEITYPNQRTQTVRCDDKLFSITAGIQKNKSDLFTKRNPGVVYAHVVAGSRKRRRKNKKNSYGMENGS